MTVTGVFEWLGTGRNFEFILEGFAINLEIAAVAMLLSLIAGLALALLRLSRVGPVSVAAGIWVDTFRNLPLIFLLLFLGLWLPGSWRESWSDFVPGWAPDAYESGFVLAAFIGLTLYNSAVIGEIMRAGILSLPRGQQEAAAALGMTYRQQMRHVILPQGLRRMVPATVGQLITLNKDTTLVSIIAIQEVMRNGRTVTATAGNPYLGGGGGRAPILEVFLFIGLLFVAVNFTLSRLSRRLEVRERARTGAKEIKISGLEDQTV